MRSVGTSCVNEASLLAVASGETISSELADHLLHCESCRARLQRMKADIRALRDGAGVEGLGAIAGSGCEAPGVGVDPSHKPDAPRLPSDRFASETPDRIGRYQVIEEIARGGQGRVFRVMHPTLKSQAVLKLAHNPLPPDEADGDRLVREGRMLRELEHPNLARVLDLDFFEERPYLVMEFIRGERLGQVLKDRATPLPPREAAGIAAKVARAVAAAHACGIYHRDITPNNIIIDEHGHPRLIDFGLARYRHAWGEHVEQDGTVAGTPAYMAPEQAEGRTSDIDGRTDVFGIGMVLRRMILGSAPSALGSAPSALGSAPSALGSAPSALGGARVSGQPAVGGGQVAIGGPGPQSDQNRGTPADAILPTAHRRPPADVPTALQAIIARATQPKPEHRYQSALELANDLERFVARPTIIRRWVLGTVAVLAAAAAVLLATWPSPPVMPPEDQEVLRIGHPDSLVSNHLPLDERSRLIVVADVPRGMTPLAFWADWPDGVADVESLGRDLRKQHQPDLPYDRYVAWDDRQQVIGRPDPRDPDGRLGLPPLPDPPGTKLVLIVGAPKPLTDAQQQAIVAALRELKLPLLPRRMMLRITANGVALIGSERGTVARQAQSEVAQVQAGLETLRQRLTELQVPYFTGVAVPYYQAGTTTRPGEHE